MDNGTVARKGAPLVAIAESERRLDGRVEGNAPFF
jgi:hypothetical protein